MWLLLGLLSSARGTRRREIEIRYRTAWSTDKKKTPPAQRREAINMFCVQ
jgi:hypothetical protein